MRSASTCHGRPPGGGPAFAASPHAGAEHFAALCRGVVVLVGLALPVALTLACAAPPKPASGHASGGHPAPADAAELQAATTGSLSRSSSTRTRMFSL